MDIEINKIKYPVSFKINAIRAFCRHKGIDKVNDFDLFIQELTKKMGTGEMTFTMLDDVCDLIFFAIKEGCRKSGQNLDIEREDVLDLVSDHPREFTRLFTDQLKEDLPGGKKMAPARKRPGK